MPLSGSVRATVAGNDPAEDSEGRWHCAGYGANRHGTGSQWGGLRRNGRPESSVRITCWEQHRRRATTTIPTDKIAGQLATDEVPGHYLDGSILAWRSCESTSRRWINRSAVRRPGTWWVRSPSAIPGHFSVGVDSSGVGGDQNRLDPVDRNNSTRINATVTISGPLIGVSLQGPYPI